MNFRFFCGLCVCLLLCVGVSTASFADGSSFHEKIKLLKAKDNLEGFIYAHLDEFLRDPAYDRLYLLEEVSQKQWRKPKTMEEHLASTILLCNKGYYNLQYSQINEAVNAYEEAWKYDRKFNFKDFDIIEYCLKPLGNAYSMLGDYTSAESIIKSYLLKAQSTGVIEQQVAALINLSIVYHDTGRSSKAIDILKEAASSETDKAGLIYSNLAKNHLNLNEIDEATAYALKAVKYFSEDQSQDGINYLANIYSTLASISLQALDTVQALTYLIKAEKLAEVSEVIKPREHAKIIIQQAGIQSALGEYSSALKNYQRALRRLIPDFDRNKPFPPDHSLYAENTLKEAFDGMASTYTLMNSLEAAIECYNKSLYVEELLKGTYNYKESKYLQQNENRWRAERIIDLSYRLFELSQDTAYVRQAFEIAERTKSIALMDELYSRQAWTAAANDSLLNAKKQLAKYKYHVENALIQEQLKGDKADLAAIERLIDKRNQLTMALKQLAKEMEAFIPDQAVRHINMANLQEKINSNEITAVEYFFGTSALYTFILKGSSLTMYKNSQVEEVRNIIAQYTAMFTDEVKINTAPEVFADLSQKLFKRLFPIEVNTGLLIIPDGLLNFVPFEALLTSAPAAFSGYSSWPWLINHVPIFYQYSAALYLYDFPDRQFSSDKVLGIFPHFANTDRFLKYSKNEATGIREHFNGDFFNHGKATKQAFLKRAANYPIVHLSTHAKAGGIHEPPSIAFIDSALYLPEVYGLNLNTDLLVLGACETGIGKLYKGEGPLSMASGFLHAGVKNIVLSLWKVNDYSTSVLMTNFYKHYDEQRLAHLALHQAKLDYLNDEQIAADKKSPYYWASFVYYGNNEVHNAGGAFFYGIYIFIAAVGLLGLLTFLYYRRRQ